MIKKIVLSRRHFGVLTFAFMMSLYRRPAVAGTEAPGRLPEDVPPLDPHYIEPQRANWAAREYLRPLELRPHPLGMGFGIEEEPLSILQGLTDETSAQFSVVGHRDETLHFEVVSDVLGLPEGQVTNRRIERADSEWVIDRPVVTGLNLNQKYRLRVLDAENRLRDEREFHLLDLEKTTAQFAIASCINDQYESTETWLQLSKDRPEMLFLIGDVAYTDHVGFRRKAADPAQLWERHAETRRHIAFYYFKRLVPTLVTWDDHDFGLNNGDRTYRYKNESAEILLSFFPQDPAYTRGLKRGPGIASLWQAFGQNFFLLDGRSFRDPEGAGQNHWGVEQEAWFALEAQASNRPTWWMNGSQFFGAYMKQESVEGQHFESLERLRVLLTQLPQVSLLASGDIHFSEYMRIEKSWIGYETLELTSSSVGSLHMRGMDYVYTNSRRIGSSVRHNYQLITTEVMAGPGGGSVLKLKTSTRAAGDVTTMELAETLQR